MYNAFGRHFCLECYPPSSTPYRFLNSGVWMGRAPAVYELLVEAMAYLSMDDQSIYAHIFLDGSRWRSGNRLIALDYNATLLQSMHGHHQPATPHTKLNAFLARRRALNNPSRRRTQVVTAGRALSQERNNRGAAQTPSTPLSALHDFSRTLPLANLRTGSTPLVLHFNGGSKHLLPRFVRLLARQAAADAQQPGNRTSKLMFHTPAGLRTYDQICGTVE
jgi:hypothetical protein